VKAIVFEGRKKVNVAAVPDPEIKKDDDIIVRVTATAICGSDLHIYHGFLPSMPKGFVLGHETMGIVEEAGKGVINIKKGDRVVIPFPIACGRCRYCEEDLSSQCDNSNPNAEMGGIFGCGPLFGGYEGGQAEYIRVPYANAGPVVVPDELTDEQALFLSDILPTSYWAAETGGIKNGDTVVVLGCGPVGLLTMKWAAFFGAERIIAVDNLGYRLEHALSRNGAEVLDFDEQDDTGELIKEMTHGGADVVIDCVGMSGKMTVLEAAETALRMQGGSKSAIETASRAVRKGGTVCLVGDYGTRYNNFPLGDFFARGVTLKMGQCPAQGYTGRILRLPLGGQFDATGIITHRLPLEQGEHAYRIFDKKEEECVKVILLP